ncbi:MAG: PTS sorbitol transporter subunit IIA [Microbacteriaceae bacterium]|nr:MAG: PTS sorbitol transporter subunit IIA [Microbacteriaceae bacterium]
MRPYFRSEVTSVGSDATDLINGGVTIFFAEPCPTELMEVSIVHRTIQVDPQRDPYPGDVLRVGESEVVLTAVGAAAGDNLRNLGHLVVYCNPNAGQVLLPGAVLAAGEIGTPSPGALVEITPGVS